MRNVEIAGYGVCLPTNSIMIDGETRYRINNDKENQITMAVNAIEKALNKAKVTINDIDCIVSASAVGFQPIPCTAALIHEQIAKGTEIPAIDINTTCTSFISALDTMSYLIEAGKYKTVLIVSSEYGSQGLNPNQKESYELFSDGAAAIVLKKSINKKTGIIASTQKTWSEGAHSTEIRGGLTRLLARDYNEDTKDDYYFDMHGKEVLLLAARKLPKMLNEFYAENKITIDDIDLVIPHQASKALGMIMNKVGIPENKYVNFVSEYGNMIAASIPVALCRAIDEAKIKKDDMVMLIGTAAGLTSNILIFKY